MVQSNFEIYGNKNILEFTDFRNFTDCNNFSKVSLHFKKMENSSRKVLQPQIEL